MVWEKAGSVILNPAPKAVQSEFLLVEPSLLRHSAFGIIMPLVYSVWFGFCTSEGARDPIPWGPRGGCGHLSFLVRSSWQGTANSREHVSRPEVAHDRTLSRRTHARRGGSSEPAELVLRRPGKRRCVEIGRLRPNMGTDLRSSAHAVHRRYRGCPFRRQYHLCR